MAQKHLAILSFLLWQHVLGESEIAILHRADLPHEIEWDPRAMHLNITSLSGRPFSAHLWHDGKIEQYRATSLVLEGKYHWMELTNHHSDENRVKIKWRYTERTSWHWAFPVAILLSKILAIIGVPYFDKLFLVCAIAFALSETGFENFAERLLHAWSVK